MISDDVPAELRCLEPLVARWGIGDDLARGVAIEEASSAELHALVHEVDVVVDVLDGWLCGPAASGLAPASTGYAAYACLSMAHLEAIAELECRERNSSK